MAHVAYTFEGLLKSNIGHFETFLVLSQNKLYHDFLHKRLVIFKKQGRVLNLWTDICTMVPHCHYDIAPLMKLLGNGNNWRNANDIDLGVWIVELSGAQGCASLPDWYRPNWTSAGADRSRAFCSVCTNIVFGLFHNMCPFQLTIFQVQRRW